MCERERERGRVYVIILYFTFRQLFVIIHQLQMNSSDYYQGNEWVEPLFNKY